MTENNCGAIPSLMLKTESLSINDEDKHIGPIVVHRHKITTTKNYRVKGKLYTIVSETEKEFTSSPGSAADVIVYESTPSTKYLSDNVICSKMVPGPSETDLTMEERLTLKEKSYTQKENGVSVVVTNKTLKLENRDPNGDWTNIYTRNYPEVKAPQASFS